MKDESFKSFEIGTVKLTAKETIWSSLEVRTYSTFLETLISKYDFGTVKVPLLSRNGPRDTSFLTLKGVQPQPEIKGYIEFRSIFRVFA